MEASFELGALVASYANQQFFFSLVKAFSVVIGIDEMTHLASEYSH